MLLGDVQKVLWRVLRIIVAGCAEYGAFRRFVVGALFGGFLDEIRVYLTQ